MCGTLPVEPVACTPASGWEKGQVENQVGTVRQRSSRRGCGSGATRAERLARRPLRRRARRSRIRRCATGRSGRCSRPSGRAWCRTPDRSTASAHASLAIEDLPRPLRQQQILGDGERGRPAGRGPRLRRSDRAAAGRPDRRAASRVFGRGQTVYDPWHYVPVLARKPGALRNGALPGTGCCRGARAECAAS